MDVNNTGSSITRSVPVNLEFALMKDDIGRKNDASLTESEKEHIIMKCKDAKSEAEMKKIVEEMVPDGNLNSVFEDPITD